MDDLGILSEREVQTAARSFFWNEIVKFKFPQSTKKRDQFFVLHKKY